MMGRRLLTKAPRVNAKGDMLVNFAADRVDGVQVSESQTYPLTCVPFGSGSSALADRKYTTVTFPTDTVSVGDDPASEASAYFSRGTGRGSTKELPPVTSAYSNRKQFLRGQYLSLAILPAVQLCAFRQAAVEEFIGDVNGRLYRYMIDQLDLVLDPGHNYVGGRPVGSGVGAAHTATNATILGQTEAYFRSAEFGFPSWVPITELEGGPKDVAFKLYGEVIPAPGVSAVFAVSVFVIRRRRRRA